MLRWAAAADLAASVAHPLVEGNSVVVAGGGLGDNLPCSVVVEFHDVAL